jgi:hypothetical protein
VARQDIALDDTLPSPGEAYALDEDYVSPWERAETLALFKPGRLRGAADAASLARSMRALRAVEAEPEAPFWNGRVLALALAAAAAGALVGWIWRMHREKKARAAKSASTAKLGAPGGFGLTRWSR